MEQSSTEGSEESRVNWAHLEAFARLGVQRWLQKVLEEEVATL